MQIRKISGGELVRPHEKEPLYYTTHFVDKTRLCAADWGGDCPWCDQYIGKRKAFFACATAPTGSIAFIELPAMTIMTMYQQHATPWNRAWRIRLDNQYAPPVMVEQDEKPGKPYECHEWERLALFCRLFRLPEPQDPNATKHLTKCTRFMVAR